ncbi:hypothetical protein [Magnetococcus marinus]|uniref:hypothetical protein n=1 Tax=Magnetococcus marinus TaxID=1124597 RepID=UPI00003814EB|nr:hypothetical protein [Magnetococcus marinus]
MAKTTDKTSNEILDQVVKAREALDYFSNKTSTARGERQDGAEIRARLNAAKAHILRALEKAQSLR